MKPLAIIFFLLISLLSVSAQTSNLVIFSDEGKAFAAYVNGEQLKGSQTNVRKTDIAAEGVKVRIVFGKDVPELSKYVMLTPGEETTLGIVKNKKGEYTFRLVSSAPVASSTYIESYPVVDNRSYDVNNGNVNTTTTTVQSTTVSQVNNNGSVTIASGMGMPGDVNANIIINAHVNEPAISSTTVTTTSTTSSVSSSNDDGYSNSDNRNHKSSHSYGRDWEACALHHNDYESALNSIRSKSFSDAKMTIAKQVIKNNCVNTNQVKGIAQLFDFEQDKLAFVKFAYAYTSDRNNYYKINDVFTYETTIDELNKYIEAQQ